MDSMSTLEYSMLKVPYELLNKVYRNSQKDLDRENSALQNLLTKLLHNHPADVSRKDHILQSLTDIRSRLEDFPTHLTDCVAEQEKELGVCSYRVGHLKQFLQAELTNSKGTSRSIVNNPELTNEGADLSEFEAIRVARMLVEHLLRMGYIETAVSLSQEKDIMKLVDIDVFLLSRNIEQELRAHNPEPCLAWCHSNKSKLKKLHSSLETNVRIQQFVELVKSNYHSDAISHAKKYFTQVDESFLPDVQCAMGLLCFPRDTHLSRYQAIFSDHRWDELILQFKTDSYSLLQISSQSHLATTLQAGLSALKTHICSTSNPVNNQCPLCTFPFNHLAETLPYAKYTRSRLVCSITNTPMDEDNTPLALPNGRVYGEKGILEKLDQNGTFTCPVTNEHYQLSECKKVYIL